MAREASGVARGSILAVVAIVAVVCLFAAWLVGLPLHGRGLAGNGAERAGAPEAQPIAAAGKPVWTAMSWPFPADAWGRGKAFLCRPEHCGTQVTVYLRAKTGLCGCITSIDDDGVERGSDLDLLASDRRSVGGGRPIDVRGMKGRSRVYLLSGTGATSKSAVAVAFHDRCDMVVATAAVVDDQAIRHEAAVIQLLNSDVVWRWVEVTLGL